MVILANNNFGFVTVTPRVPLTECCSLPVRDDEGIPACDGVEYGCHFCCVELCSRQVASWERYAANYSHPVCAACTRREATADAYGQSDRSE